MSDRDDPSPTSLSPEEVTARLLARYRDTLARHGVALPIVDIAIARAEDGGAATFDVEQLCLWVVREHAAELAPFELVLEAVLDEPWRAIVLYAGTTAGPRPRHVERRLEIEIEEDLLYYTDRYRFSLRSSTTVIDEPNAVRLRTPRWVTRLAPRD